MGSEMCIRDRFCAALERMVRAGPTGQSSSSHTPAALLPLTPEHTLASLEIEVKNLRAQVNLLTQEKLDLTKKFEVLKIFKDKKARPTKSQRAEKKKQFEEPAGPSGPVPCCRREAPDSIAYAETQVAPDSVANAETQETELRASGVSALKAELGASCVVGGALTTELGARNITEQQLVAVSEAV